MIERILKLEGVVRKPYCKIKEGGLGGGLQSIVPGANIIIDNTDPLNPVVSSIDEVIGDVSATQRGAVNNISLQELGGVDKNINGHRIGRGAGNRTTNVALGRSALNSNTTGTGNTAIGSAGNDTQGVLQNNTTGTQNTSVGALTMVKNTIGTQNSAFGTYALGENTTGSQNSAFGNGVLYGNTTGVYNTGFGTNTLQNNTTGNKNIGVGTSLYWNGTGGDNTGIGFNAGYAATSGSFNTYIGSGAGYQNGVGSYNVVVGDASMTDTIGGKTASSKNYSNNVFIGSNLYTGPIVDTLVIDNKGGVATSPQNALLYGGFSVANRFLNIGGKFSITPAYLTADVDYLKNIVAKTDGTFGWVDIKEKGTFTVSTLPVGTLGQTAIVTDATDPTYLGILIGGGTVATPVWHNGSIWVSR